MPRWLTLAEARAAFPERLTTAAFDDARLDAARRRAEAHVGSVLGTRYGTEDLPSTPAQTPEALKRLVANVTQWEAISEKWSVVEDTVVEVFNQTEKELAALARGVGTLGLDGSPGVDDPRLQIRYTPLRRGAITHELLEGW